MSGEPDWKKLVAAVAGRDHAANSHLRRVFRSEVRSILKKPGRRRAQSAKRVSFSKKTQVYSERVSPRSHSVAPGDHRRSSQDAVAMVASIVAPPPRRSRSRAVRPVASEREDSKLRLAKAMAALHAGKLQQAAKKAKEQKQKQKQKKSVRGPPKRSSSVLGRLFRRGASRRNDVPADRVGEDSDEEHSVSMSLSLSSLSDKDSVEPADGALFGVPLSKVYGVLMSEPGIPDPCIPHFLRSCFHELDTRASSSLGLFRLPGRASDVEKARRDLDEGLAVPFNKLDVDTIASLIKLWLRELPEPLFPFSVFDTVLSVAQADDEQAAVESLRPALDEIPRYNRLVIAALFDFLHRFSIRHAEHRMTLDNLAIVFSPTLLRSQSEDHSSIIRNSKLAPKALAVVMRNFATLFPEHLKLRTSPPGRLNRAQYSMSGKGEVDLDVKVDSSELKDKELVVGEPHDFVHRRTDSQQIRRLLKEADRIKALQKKGSNPKLVVRRDSDGKPVLQLPKGPPALAMQLADAAEDAFEDSRC